MFENGSYLRRRKRFKLFDGTNQNDDDQMIFEKPIVRKTSFFIDELLADHSNSNAYEKNTYDIECPATMYSLNRINRKVSKKNKS